MSFFVEKLSVVHHDENNYIRVLSFVSRRRHLMWIATFRQHTACLLQATRSTFFTNYPITDDDFLLSSYRFIHGEKN